MNILHLGQALRKELKRQNYPVKKPAQQLGLARSSVYYLMKNRHFSTDLLWKISLALNHNFFQHFDPTYGPSDPLTEARQQVESIEQQLAGCRAGLATTQQALRDSQQESQRHREVANAIELSLKAMAGMKGAK